MKENSDDENMQIESDSESSKNAKSSKCEGKASNAAQEDTSYVSVGSSKDIRVGSFKY